MERLEIAAQVERMCALYPKRTTPEYIEALTAELWAKYGAMKPEKFKALVDEALSLSEWPPTLAAFAAADAAIKKRHRDLPRDAAGFLI